MIHLVLLSNRKTFYRLIIMLLHSYKLNDTLTLSNRVVMAPMTRCFADSKLVPTQAMATYYAKRASAGLIITEATIIRADGQGYPNCPGIFNKEQIKGWEAVTKAVHNQGGKIFCQLWHTGRVAHSHYTGKAPIAPSAVALDDRVPRTDSLRYEMPQALSEVDILGLINDYILAAKNALDAGFDGVEIHGANGYLIDQFLHQQTNLRNDDWGGTPEKRARFVLEIISEITQAINSERVGLRLSPAAYFNLEPIEGDEKTFEYLLGQLESFNLAYVHVGMFDDSTVFDYLDGRVSEFIRRHYSGKVIGCGGYTQQTAEQELKNNSVDLVAFGRPFISNPNLVEKFNSLEPINDYNPEQLGELV